MTAIIVLALAIWAISAVTKSAKAKQAERNRQAQIARINRENAQRKAEAQRIREEFKARQLEAKLEVERMVAIEREQIRQAKEIEKHEAWLKKHDEEIAKLTFRISEAERTIAHFTPLYDALKAQYDELTLKIKFYEQRGLLTGGAKKELEKVSNKLYAVETKINKAKFDKEQAERKIA